MAPEDDLVPLDDSLVRTFDYHGRVFQTHALTEGVYFAPVDEAETTRLGLLHEVMNVVFNRQLIYPAMAPPALILDCGCGGGHWASAVAAENPGAEVVGTDISPHMLPDEAAPNVELQVDDHNESFTFTTSTFDLVHSRCVGGGIDADRWESYVSDIFRVLKPGGWCQMSEIYMNAQSDNGRLTPDHALSRWSELYLESLERYKDPRAPMKIDAWMRKAGFVNIDRQLIPLPMSAWPTGEKEHLIGSKNNPHVNELLYAVGLYPMTHFQGLTIDEFETLVEKARAEAADAGLKPYFPLYVVIGRKPE